MDDKDSPETASPCCDLSELGLEGGGRKAIVIAAGADCDCEDIRGTIMKHLKVALKDRDNVVMTRLNDEALEQDRRPRGDRPVQEPLGGGGLLHRRGNEIEAGSLRQGHADHGADKEAERRAEANDRLTQGLVPSSPSQRSLDLSFSLPMAQDRWCPLPSDNIHHSLERAQADALAELLIQDAYLRRAVMLT